MASKMLELLTVGRMLCAGGGVLIAAGIVLTFLESLRLRGRAGVVLVAMGAVLLIVAAFTVQQPT
jgi:hypothetical protein